MMDFCLKCSRHIGSPSSKWDLLTRWLQLSIFVISRFCYLFFLVVVCFVFILTTSSLKWIVNIGTKLLSRTICWKFNRNFRWRIPKKSYSPHKNKKNKNVFDLCRTNVVFNNMKKKNVGKSIAKLGKNARAHHDWHFRNKTLHLIQIELDWTILTNSVRKLPNLSGDCNVISAGNETGHETKATLDAKSVKRVTLSSWK